MAFKNKFGLIKQAPSVFYTAPVGQEAVVHSVFISANVPTTNINLEVVDTVAAVGVILKDVPVIAGGTMYLPKPVNLSAGESLRANCTLDDDANITISLLEQAAV